MNLKKAIIFLLATLSYTILLNICIIILPDIFNSISFFRIENIFLFFLGLSFIVFGLYFIKEAVGKNRVKLKTSIYLAMTGPAFFMFINLYYIIKYSDRLALKLYELSPFLHQFILGTNFKPLNIIVELLGAIFLFYFVYVLYKSLNTENKELKKLNYLLVIGYALDAVPRAFSFVISFLFPDSGLISDPPKILFVISFLIFLFKYLVSISFFLKLYRVKDYSRILKIE
jgi:hypothetical protein